MSTAIEAQKPDKISLLKRVFAFAKPYRKKFYGSLVLSILLAVMAPVRPMLIQVTINAGLKENAAAWFVDGPGGFYHRSNHYTNCAVADRNNCKVLFYL
jgi:ABC-type multidrug transport system fused ATPase/permease subunit